MTHIHSIPSTPSQHSDSIAVSIIHIMCTDTCKFIETSIKRRIEREQVDVDNRSFLYKHEWTNDLYCLNTLYYESINFFRVMFVSCLQSV